MRTRALGAMAIAAASLIFSSGAYADGSHDHGAVAGAGQPGKASEASRMVKLDTLDQTYSMKQIQVKPGETIRFVITNKSSINHEFAIGTRKDQLAHREMMRAMPDMKHNAPNVVTLQPGETKELIWRFGSSREALKDLEFVCNIPGHAEGGMIGTFRAL